MVDGVAWISKRKPHQNSDEPREKKAVLLRQSNRFGQYGMK